MNSYLNNKSIREKKIDLQKDQNIFRNRILFLLFVVFFGFLYLWQVNKVSTKGYEISLLENKITDLEYENKNLEVQIASFTSMNNLKNRLESKKMVAVNDIKYISVIENNIAQR